MSARGQPKVGGVQARPDLFESARATGAGGGGGVSERGSRADVEMDELDPATRDQELHELYGAGNLDEDPLQLEHMIGFNGENHNAVMTLPYSDGLYVKR
jgi:hypothetical protein